MGVMSRIAALAAAISLSLAAGAQAQQPPQDVVHVRPEDVPKTIGLIEIGIGREATVTCHRELER